MKPKAYFLIFDGMVDGESAHALCEINKSGKYDVVTVGFSAEPFTTMGGLRVVPKLRLTMSLSLQTKPVPLTTNEIQTDTTGDLRSKERVRSGAKFMA